MHAPLFSKLDIRAAANDLQNDTLYWKSGCIDEVFVYLVFKGTELICKSPEYT